MIPAEPDYKIPYEQSQKELAQVQQQLALLDANELRRKLFGIKSDNRVKKAVTDGQLDMFPLGATDQDQQASEALTVVQVQQSNVEQDRQAEKRQKTAISRSRMVLPESLEREELILDPEGDLSAYQVIDQEVTEVLVMVPA